MILETERLLLREMVVEDLPQLAEILQDEQIMYAYEGAMSETETKEWLDKQLIRYKEDGFGLWAAVLKNTGEMIGQCGLSWQYADGKRVLEVGYLFNRAYWNRGYAIEAAKGCKRYAFDTLNADEVYSIIRDTNLASINVAIRNGMLVRGYFVKHYRGVAMPHLILSVKRSPPRGRNGNQGNER
jgi:RimJ/RimL family protein N-acetyltransferase